MLTVELDLDRITRVQTAYLDLGTRRGVTLANQVRRLRDVFSHGARRFAQRQAAAAGKGAPLLADGRQSTLESEVFGPMARHGWPLRAAAVLHGLHLPAPPLLPASACRPGGAAWSALDPESYLTRLDDGPPQERSFGDMTALVVYLAPFERLRLVWIGQESDVLEARAALEAETAGFTAWRALAPDYAAWLEQACGRGDAS